ncbi:DUF86 domain-containing protein [Alkalihalobacillus sp. LMS39]|uniref:DUF86 domain-containing protein n=1 Tax=Alkalihalobacillus sp. LMS39 TaxID=2924032 RepID=UPI001FB3D079|nr:DUF86 domain-containing protein [Alkalihalobacillus sp. LMS39]UOE96546.1 DUF86 domain-containing protein [Alkalihalobacillus sp. LMS39]
MYFVDRQKIEDTLVYYEQCIALYDEGPNWESSIAKLGLERLVHLFIEGILDVGNQMIDGFIMRDPGSYEDIIDILEDEMVVPKEEAEQLRDFIKLRKMVVQSYIHVDHSMLQEKMKEHKKAIQAFPTRVRSYIVKELGPVSAFLPNQK